LIGLVLAFFNHKKQGLSHELDPLFNANEKFVVPSKRGNLQIQSLKDISSLEPHPRNTLNIDNITRSFSSSTEQILFQNLSFSVNPGSMFLIGGPSGVGKSQLLRNIGGLSPIQEGSIHLGKTELGDEINEWRKNVRYVTQHKVDIPGTPYEFIQRVTSFKTWKQSNHQDLFQITQDLVLKFGLPIDCLHKDWTLLSGGEAQRVIVAVALASRPKVLLLDESTSALDIKSKISVERSVQEFVSKFHSHVLWVSHDEDQIERLKGLS